MGDVLDSGAAAAAIMARRAILEWRDRHLIAATLIISRAWQDVKPLVQEKLAAISWRSVLLEADAFIAREIDPTVLEAVNNAAQRVIAGAQAELSKLIAHQMEVETNLSQTPAGQDSSAGNLDLITGLAPLAGGVAAGAAVPGLAIVSGTALFGLVATSAISAPILIGGLFVAGAGIATGAFQTSKIKDKRAARILERVSRHVDAGVFSLDPQSASPSVLLRLQHEIDAAAKTALERLEHAG